MESTHVLEITEHNYEDEVGSSPQPVILDFWGANCDPCRRFAPVFADAAVRHAGRIRFGSVNVAENYELSVELQVQAMPTVLFIRDGNEVGRFRGALSSHAFEEKINQFLGGS